jgi:lysophospholipase L1-like esterase
MLKHLSYVLVVMALVACSKSGGGGGGAVDPRCNCKATQPSEVKNSHPQPGPIVILGDSLADGMGADLGAGVTPAECLGNAFGAQVQILSQPGNTSAGVYQELWNVQQMKPSLVFVSTGGNDAYMEYAKPGSYPEDKSMREAKHIFDGLVKSGALVVYLGLRPPYPSSDRLFKMWDVATSKGVVVVDGMEGLWQNKSLMEDEFHPNTEGYRMMCDRILQAISGHYP